MAVKGSLMLIQKPKNVYLHHVSSNNVDRGIFFIIIFNYFFSPLVLLTLTSRLFCIPRCRMLIFSWYESIIWNALMMVVSSPTSLHVRDNAIMGVQGGWRGLDYKGSEHQSEWPVFCLWGSPISSCRVWCLSAESKVFSDHGGDRVECWAEINKQHSDVQLFLFFSTCVKTQWWAVEILCGSVGWRGWDVFVTGHCVYYSGQIFSENHSESMLTLGSISVLSLVLLPVRFLHFWYFYFWYQLQV